MLPTDSAALELLCRIWFGACIGSLLPLDGVLLTGSRVFLLFAASLLVAGCGRGVTHSSEPTVAAAEPSPAAAPPPHIVVSKAPT